MGDYVLDVGHILLSPSFTGQGFQEACLTKQDDIKLPLIVLVTADRPHLDDATAPFATPQLMWIDSIMEQKRVNVVEKRGRIVSIIEECKVKFNLRKKHRKTLKYILKNYVLPEEVTGGKGFEDYLKSHGIVFNPPITDPMQLHEAKQQRFFKGHFIKEGGILVNAISFVMADLPLTLRIAHGFQRGAESSERWKQLMDMYQGASFSFDQTFQRAKPPDVMIVTAGHSNLPEHSVGSGVRPLQLEQQDQQQPQQQQQYVDERRSDGTSSTMSADQGSSRFRAAGGGTAGGTALVVKPPEYGEDDENMQNENRAVPRPVTLSINEQASSVTSSAAGATGGIKQPKATHRQKALEINNNGPEADDDLQLSFREAQRPRNRGQDNDSETRVIVSHGRNEPGAGKGRRAEHERELEQAERGSLGQGSDRGHRGGDVRGAQRESAGREDEVVLERERRKHGYENVVIPDAREDLRVERGREEGRRERGRDEGGWEREEVKMERTEHRVEHRIYTNVEAGKRSEPREIVEDRAVIAKDSRNRAKAQEQLSESFVYSNQDEVKRGGGERRGDREGQRGGRQREADEDDFSREGVVVVLDEGEVKGREGKKGRKGDEFVVEQKVMVDRKGEGKMERDAEPRRVNNRVGGREEEEEEDVRGEGGVKNGRRDRLVSTPEPPLQMRSDQRVAGRRAGGGGGGGGGGGRRIKDDDYLVPNDIEELRGGNGVYHVRDENDENDYDDVAGVAVSGKRRGGGGGGEGGGRIRTELSEEEPSLIIAPNRSNPPLVPEVVVSSPTEPDLGPNLVTSRTKPVVLNDEDDDVEYSRRNRKPVLAPLEIVSEDTDAGGRRRIVDDEDELEFYSNNNKSGTAVAIARGPQAYGDYDVGYPIAGQRVERIVYPRNDSWTDEFQNHQPQQRRQPQQQQQQSVVMRKEFRQTTRPSWTYEGDVFEPSRVVYPREPISQRHSSTFHGTVVYGGPSVSAHGGGGGGGGRRGPAPVPDRAVRRSVTSAARTTSDYNNIRPIESRVYYEPTSPTVRGVTEGGRHEGYTRYSGSGYSRSSAYISPPERNGDRVHHQRKTGGVNQDFDYYQHGGARYARQGQPHGVNITLSPPLSPPGTGGYREGYTAAGDDYRLTRGTRGSRVVASGYVDGGVQRRQQRVPMWNTKLESTDDIPNQDNPNPIAESRRISLHNSQDGTTGASSLPYDASNLRRRHHDTGTLETRQDVLPSSKNTKKRFNSSSPQRNRTIVYADHFTTHSPGDAAGERFSIVKITPTQDFKNNKTLTQGHTKLLLLPLPHEGRKNLIGRELGLKPIRTQSLHRPSRVRRARADRWHSIGGFTRGNYQPRKEESDDDDDDDVDLVRLRSRHGTTERPDITSSSSRLARSKSFLGMRERGDMSGGGEEKPQTFDAPLDDDSLRRRHRRHRHHRRHRAPPGHDSQGADQEVRRGGDQGGDQGGNRTWRDQKNGDFWEGEELTDSGGGAGGSRGDVQKREADGASSLLDLENEGRGVHYRRSEYDNGNMADGMRGRSSRGRYVVDGEEGMKHDRGGGSSRSTGGGGAGECKYRVVIEVGSEEVRGSSDAVRAGKQGIMEEFICEGKVRNDGDRVSKTPGGFQQSLGGRKVRGNSISGEGVSVTPELKTERRYVEDGRPDEKPASRSDRDIKEQKVRKTKIAAEERADGGKVQVKDGPAAENLSRTSGTAAEKLTEKFMEELSKTGDVNLSAATGADSSASGAKRRGDGESLPRWGVRAAGDRFTASTATHGMTHGVTEGEKGLTVPSIVIEDTSGSLVGGTWRGSEDRAEVGEETVVGVGRYPGGRGVAVAAGGSGGRVRGGRRGTGRRGDRGVTGGVVEGGRVMGRDGVKYDKGGSLTNVKAAAAVWSIRELDQYLQAQYPDDISSVAEPE